MFKCNFLYFSLCPLPLVLPLGTTEQSLAPSFLHSPFRCAKIYIKEMPSELSLLQVKQSQLSQSFLLGEMFWSLNHLGGLRWTLSSTSMSLILGSPALDQHSSCGLISAGISIITFLDLLATLLLMQPRTLLVVQGHIAGSCST